MSGGPLGECGRPLLVGKRPARCWRVDGHELVGGCTPDGYYVKSGTRLDDRPKAMRPKPPAERTVPTDPPTTLSEDELAAGRRLREQARARGAGGR